MKLKKRPLHLLLILFFIMPFLVGCIKTGVAQSSILNHNPMYSEKDFLAHYIDVGQGDSILIQINNKNLLIDAGTRDSSAKITSYLLKQGVKKIDYVVATHPHEDHIGGMAEVINKFVIGDFYAPKITSNTRAFENMVSALKGKGMKINAAKAGVNLNLGEGVLCEVLAPVNGDYEDLNNYSAIIKISYGQNKFIFTGDAEKQSEKEMLQKDIDLTADVIKIGHHGSSSSSSKEFLDSVNPSIAVISCGTSNDYGHPHGSLLSELSGRKITVYRTDRNKDILLISNGKNIVKK